MSTSQAWKTALAVIRRKLDSADILSRKGGGNRDIDYISGERLRELLDEAVGPENWTFECTPPVVHQISNGYVISVKGSLTILGVKKEHIGVCDGKQDSQYETAVKGAATDALKKTASLFGFFAELYPNSVQNPVVWAKWNESRIARVKELVKTKEIDDVRQPLMDWSMLRFPTELPIYYNLAHIECMYPAYLKDFIQYLEEL